MNPFDLKSTDSDTSNSLNTENFLKLSTEKRALIIKQHLCTLLNQNYQQKSKLQEILKQYEKTPVFKDKLYIPHISNQINNQEEISINEYTGLLQKYNSYLNTQYQDSDDTKERQIINNHCCKKDDSNFQCKHMKDADDKIFLHKIIANNHDTTVENTNDHVVKDRILEKTNTCVRDLKHLDLLKAKEILDKDTFASKYFMNIYRAKGIDALVASLDKHIVTYGLDTVNFLNKEIISVLDYEEFKQLAGDLKLLSLSKFLEMKEYNISKVPDANKNSMTKYYFGNYQRDSDDLEEQEQESRNIQTKYFKTNHFHDNQDVTIPQNYTKLGYHGNILDFRKELNNTLKNISSTNAKHNAWRFRLSSKFMSEMTKFIENMNINLGTHIDYKNKTYNQEQWKEKSNKITQRFNEKYTAQDTHEMKLWNEFVKKNISQELYTKIEKLENGSFMDKLLSIRIKCVLMLSTIDFDQWYKSLKTKIINEKRFLLDEKLYIQNKLEKSRNTLFYMQEELESLSKLFYATGIPRGRIKPELMLMANNITKKKYERLQLELKKFQDEYDKLLLESKEKTQLIDKDLKRLDQVFESIDNQYFISLKRNDFNNVYLLKYLESINNCEENGEFFFLNDNSALVQSSYIPDKENIVKKMIEKKSVKTVSEFIKTTENYNKHVAKHIINDDIFVINKLGRNLPNEEKRTKFQKCNQEDQVKFINNYFNILTPISLDDIYENSFYYSKLGYSKKYSVNERKQTTIQTPQNKTNIIFANGKHDISYIPDSKVCEYLNQENQAQNIHIEQKIRKSIENGENIHFIGKNYATLDIQEILLKTFTILKEEFNDGSLYNGKIIVELDSPTGISDEKAKEMEKIFSTLRLKNPILLHCFINPTDVTLLSGETFGLDFSSDKLDKKSRIFINNKYLHNLNHLLGYNERVHNSQSKDKHSFFTIVSDKKNFKSIKSILFDKELLIQKPSLLELHNALDIKV